MRTDKAMTPEEILAALQEFAFTHGRLVQPDDEAFSMVMRQAIRHFGSLDQALAAAGLLTTGDRSVQNELAEAIVQILASAPLTLREIRNELEGKLNSDRAPSSVKIEEAIDSAGEIRFMGFGQGKIFYLKGQEDQARIKMTRFSKELEAKISCLLLNKDVYVMAEAVGKSGRRLFRVKSCGEQNCDRLMSHLCLVGTTLVRNDQTGELQ